MAIMQPKLPYDIDALDPYVSADTLKFHYEKHHLGYVSKLNALIESTPFDSLSLEEVIDKARSTADIDVLNNALQVWNHSFLWESMSPNGGSKPDGRIKEMIETQYGDVDRFKQEFRSNALSLFGSGWVWLVLDRGKLRITTTGNADSPVGTQLTPLLTLDVWEHAYYLDYQNERKRYVDAFLDKLINWNFAASMLESEKKREAA